MKKFVRGKLGRSLSMLLLVLLMLPSLTVPLASRVDAAIGGRTNIVFMPLASTAEDAPAYLGAKITQEMLITMAKQPGVQVSELEKNSPLMRRAREQMEDASKSFNAEEKSAATLLMQRYDEAANAKSEDAVRAVAAADLVRMLGVDALVFGTIDQYEFTTRPDKQRTYLHVKAMKVTLAEDGSPLSAPFEVIGRSRELPDGGGVQGMHDREAIQEAARTLANRMLDIVPSTTTGDTTQAAPKTTPSYVDDNQTPGGGKKKPNMFLILLPLLAIAAFAGGGGGGGGTTPPPVETGIGYASPNDNGFITLSLAKPTNFAQVSTFQIWREDLGAASTVQGQVRSRASYRLVKTIARDNATLSGTSVLINDDSSSSPVPQSGFLYGYQVIITFTGGTQQTLTIYNGQIPELKLAIVGPNVPPPVRLVTVTANAGGKATLHWDMANTLPAYVDGFVVQRKISGVWTTEGSQIAKNLRDVEVLLPQANTVFEYTVRTVAVGGYLYPLILDNAIVQVSSNTSYKPAAPTGVNVAAEVDSANADKVNLRINWNASSDTLVTGYDVYRAESASAGVTATASRGMLRGGSRAAGQTLIATITSRTTTTALDTTVVAGKSYVYYVDAVAANNISSNQTAATLVVTPAAPVGMTITKVDDQTNPGKENFLVAWQLPADPAVVGYEVYRTSASVGRSVGDIAGPKGKQPVITGGSRSRGRSEATIRVNRATGTPALVKTITKRTEISYLDTSLVDGTTYTYTLKAVYVNGVKSSASTGASLTYNVAPGEVSGLQALSTIGSVKIGWTAPTKNADNTTLADGAGFEIWRSMTLAAQTGTNPTVDDASRAANFTKVATVAWTKLDYTDTTAPLRQLVSYVVRPIDTGDTPAKGPFPVLQITPLPVVKSVKFELSSLTATAGAVPQEIIVTTLGADNQPLGQIPVTMAVVTANAGLLSASTNGTFGTQLAITTGANGSGTCYWKPPTPGGSVYSAQLRATITNTTMTTVLPLTIQQPVPTKAVVSSDATSLQTADLGSATTPDETVATLTIEIQDTADIVVPNRNFNLTSSDPNAAYFDTASNKYVLFANAASNTYKGNTGATGTVTLKVRAGQTLGNLTFNVVSGPATGNITLQVVPGAVKTLTFDMPDTFSEPTTATVTAKDAGGNLVPNAGITLTMNTAQVTISPASLTTDDNGLATFTLTPQQQTSPLNVRVTARAGAAQAAQDILFVPAANPELVDGEKSIVLSTTVDQVWRLRDNKTGAPLVNTAVRAAVTNGTLTTTNLTTDANGEVTISYTAPASIGNVTLTFTLASTSQRIGSTVLLKIVRTMPQNLVVSSFTASQVNLSWTIATGEIGYQIQRSLDGLTDWRLIGTVAQGFNAFSDDTVDPATEYNYRMLAVDANNGYSPWTLPVTVTTLPLPPSGVVATGTSATSVTVSWSPVRGATNLYHVQRSLDGESGWTDLGKTTIASPTTFDDTTGLTANSIYYYRVATEGVAGISAWSAVAQTATAPQAPTGLTATPNGGTSVKLAWTNIPGVEYRLQRRSGIQPFAAVGGVLPANVDSYTDTGLAANTTYYYRLAALSPFGLLSLWSSEVSITTGPASTLDLQFTTVTSTSVSLSWTNVSGEKGYDLFTNTDGGTTWTLVQSFQPDITTYTQTGLTPGSLHYFKVEAFSAAGRTPSDIKSVTTVPAAPSITGVTLTDNTATINWTDVDGETSYEIQRGSSATVWPTDDQNIRTTDADITTLLDDTLVSGSTYYYRVRAVNAGGKSTWSTASTAVALTPGAPNLTITKVEGLVAFLEWDSVPGAAGYEYEVSANKTTWPTTGVTIDVTPGTTRYEVQADLPAQYLTRFFIRVRAVNASGPSTWSAVKELVTADTATKMGTLVFTGATATSISLQWGDVDAETGYEVYSKWEFTIEDRQLIATLPPNVVRYTDSGLIPNTHHTYWVRGKFILPGLPPAYTDYSNVEDNNTMPAKPASIKATSKDDNIVLVEWEDVTGADGYEIEYNLTGTWVALATADVIPNTSHQQYEHANVPTARTIKYRVRGVNGGGYNKGDWSDIATVISGPATPANLSAVGDGTQVTLQWSNVTDVRYLLERRSGTDDWAPATPSLLPANVIKYLDTGLDANTTFYYRIAAVDAKGIHSAYSDEVIATTGPASPVTLTLTNVTSTSVTLNWTNVANETGYEVFRSLDGLNWGTPIATLGVNVITYKDTTLQSGTTYYYRVDALSAASKTSSDVRMITTAPLTPTVTAVADPAEPTITLTWTPTTGATGYEVQYRKKGDAWPADAVVDVFDDVTVTNAYTNLDLGAVYEFRLRAVNDGGKSTWSATVSATTISAAPNNVVAVPKAADQILLTWDTVPTATGYFVERMKEGDADWTRLPGPIPQPLIGTPSFTDTGLTVDTKYYYRIQAQNATGLSAYSVVVSGTTPVRQAAESFSVATKVGQSKIYYSQDADDQLANASLKISDLTFTGLTAAGSPAFGARVKFTTNRGTFVKTTTDQVLSTDKKSITGTLDQNGQMTCKFGGRIDDGIIAGVIALPTSDELGTPTFTAEDADAGVARAVSTDDNPVRLVGPPYRIKVALGDIPSHAGWPTQTDLLPVVFSVDTVPVQAQVTDLIGQPVMKEMPIWFTQSWTPWQNSAQYDYNGAKGHANIAGAYTGPISLTNETGQATAGFSSNHSGVYTIHAFAIKRGYSVSVLDGFNTNTTGGLTLPILDSNSAMPYLLPSSGTSNATAATVISGSTDLLNKTLSYYGNWTILSVSDGTQTVAPGNLYINDDPANPKIKINVDGTQTARITFTANDEDGKKVLPGVPFSVTPVRSQTAGAMTFTQMPGGVLQLSNNTDVTGQIMSFNDVSEAYVLSRADQTNPIIGNITLQFDTLRATQNLYRIPYVLLAHRGPGVTEVDGDTSIVIDQVGGEAIGEAHRIAGATDIVQPPRNSVDIRVLLQDIDKNPVPGGYILGVQGYNMPEVYYQVGGTTADEQVFTWNAPSLDLISSAANIIDRNPLPASSANPDRNLRIRLYGNSWQTPREDWIDQYVVVERPNSFTGMPASDPGYGPQPYSAEFPINLIVWNNMRLGAQRVFAGFPINFGIEKTYGGDSTITTQAATDDTGSVQAIFNTGTKGDLVRVYAYYDKNGNGLWDTDEVRTITGNIKIGLLSPQNLQVTDRSMISVTLAWDAVTDAQGYQVEYSSDNGVSWAPGADVTTTTTTIGNLTPGTTYRFRVRAYRTGLAGFTYSDWAEVTGITLLLSPGNFRADDLTETSATIAWDAVDGAMSYVLMESRDDGATWTTIPLGTGVTSYAVATFEPGKRYLYRVQAVATGTYSAIANLTVYTPLFLPNNFRATDRRATEIDLAWNPSQNATGYQIEISYDNGTQWQNQITVTGTNTTISGLTPATTYTFRVRAVGIGGSTSDWVVITVQTQ